jgi:hypothetical protein
MSNMAAAIALWIVYMVIVCAMHAFAETLQGMKWLRFLVSTVGAVLFTVGVIMTVRAENDRHDQGGQGLGPAAIVAIVTNLAPGIVFGAFTLTRNALSNRQV